MIILALIDRFDVREKSPVIFCFWMNWFWYLVQEVVFFVWREVCTVFELCNHFMSGIWIKSFSLWNLCWSCDDVWYLEYCPYPNSWSKNLPLLIYFTHSTTTLNLLLSNPFPFLNSRAEHFADLMCLENYNIDCIYCFYWISYLKST